MGRLAIAPDDLEMAREIDLAETRAEVTTKLLSYRGELRQIRTLAELSRGIRDSYLRDATLGGIVKGLSLPESEPDEWGDRELEGTRDVPLAHLAIRHGSLTLARRVRCAGIRDLALAGVAEACGDAGIAEEIVDEYEQARTLIHIGRCREDLGLLDQAISLCRDDDGMPSARFLLFDAILAKISVLRALSPEQLRLSLRP